MMNTETLSEIRGTLEPIAAQDWHGKWRVLKAIEGLDRIIATHEQAAQGDVEHTAMNILHRLDKLAQEYKCDEYGLPLYRKTPEMKQIVIEEIAALTPSEQQPGDLVEKMEGIRFTHEQVIESDQYCGAYNDGVDACIELVRAHQQAKPVEQSVDWFDKKAAMADAQKVCELTAEVEALRKFKAYVHKRLDDAGIETHPDGKHSKHGCRIGDRLDIALSRATPQPSAHQPKPQAQEVERLIKCIAECRDALASGLPYMEGSSYTSQYARDQVREQIKRCEAALSDHAQGGDL